MKITIFGDSITNGFGMWPRNEILKELIETKASNIEVQLYGMNGDDSYGALLRLKYVAEEQADLNFIFFGANDASPYHLIRPDEYQENLRKIVLQLGVEKSVLLTPPYYSEKDPTYYSSLTEVKKFRQAALDLAEELQLPVIDIFQIMMNQPDPDALLKPDGLHFTEVAYELLASEMVQMTLELIG